MFNPFNPMMGWQNAFQYGAFPTPQAPAAPPAAPTAGAFFGPRPETRQCLNCRQYGHLARNCPMRPALPAPSAAAGAPPK